MWSVRCMAKSVRASSSSMWWSIVISRQRTDCPFTSISRSAHCATLIGGTWGSEPCAAPPSLSNCALASTRSLCEVRATSSTVNFGGLRTETTNLDPASRRSSMARISATRKCSARLRLSLSIWSSCLGEPTVQSAGTSTDSSLRLPPTRRVLRLPSARFSADPSALTTESCGWVPLGAFGVVQPAARLTTTPAAILAMRRDKGALAARAGVLTMRGVSLRSASASWA